MRNAFIRPVLGYTEWSDTLSGDDVSVLPTYTQARHEAIVGEFPEDARGISRVDIFKAWSRQESGGKLWGNTGSDQPDKNTVQRTPYRIHEGNADEEGSMGFNHIIWKRLYGQDLSCKALRGYIAGTGENPDAVSINFYHPRNSLNGFLAAAAHKDCSSSDGLYRAYAETRAGSHYRVTIPESERPHKYCYEATAPDRPSSCLTDGSELHDFSNTEDAGVLVIGQGSDGV